MTRSQSGLGCAPCLSASSFSSVVSVNLLLCLWFFTVLPALWLYFGFPLDSGLSLSSTVSVFFLLFLSTDFGSPSLWGTDLTPDCFFSCVIPVFGLPSPRGEILASSHMHTVSSLEGKGINPLKCHLISLEVGTEERDFLAESPYSTSKHPAVGSSGELEPLVSSRELQHSSCLHGAGLGAVDAAPKVTHRPRRCS